MLSFCPHSFSRFLVQSFSMFHGNSFPHIVGPRRIVDNFCEPLQTVAERRILSHSIQACKKTKIMPSQSAGG
jgi:hypothetical protein